MTKPKSARQSSSFTASTPMAGRAPRVSRPKASCEIEQRNITGNETLLD